MNRANTQRLGNTFTEPNTAALCGGRKEEKKDNCCESDTGMTAVDLVFKAEEAD